MSSTASEAACISAVRDRPRVTGSMAFAGGMPSGHVQRVLAARFICGADGVARLEPTNHPLYPEWRMRVGPGRNSGHTFGYTDPRYGHVEFRGAPSAAPAGHGLVTRHPLRNHTCIGHFRAGRVLLPAGSPSCAPGFSRQRSCSEPLNGPLLVPLRRHLSAFFDNYITLRVSLLRPDGQILSKCNHA